MKYKILIVIAALMLLMTGCKTVDSEENTNAPSMFTIVETAYTYKIMYHKQTKVMYAVSYGGYNAGNFTLLVDQDGKPLLWGDTE